MSINDMERFSCEPPAQNKAINDLADGEADRGRGDKAHLCVTGTPPPPPPLNLARDCDVSSLAPERASEGGGEIDEKVAQTGGGCGDDK